MNASTGPAEPELRVIPDDPRISEVGMDRRSVASLIRTLGNGLWLGEYFNGENRMDIIMRAAGWETPEELATTPIMTPAGEVVPLGELVSIERRVLVRVVDLFVDEFDLTRLGFARSAPARTGRPGYHPAVLLMDAQIDHVTGLLMLRERQTPLPLLATPEVFSDISSGFPITGILSHYCGVHRQELPIDGSTVTLTVVDILGATQTPAARVGGGAYSAPPGPAFAEGGYEPSVSPFTDGAEADFTSAVTQYLRQLNEELQSQAKGEP